MDKIDIKKITAKEIKDDLKKRITDIHKSARDFDADEHWQKGEGFLPFAYMEADEKAKIAKKVEKAFVSENIISKLISNEQNGVLGRQPDFHVAEPGDKENKRDDKKNTTRDDLQSAIQSYFVDNEILKLLKSANRLGATQGRCVVRAYIPRGFLSEGKLPTNKTLTEAMELLKFEVLTADRAGVFIDKSSFGEMGVYLSEDDDGKVSAEITYADEKGKTRLRVIDEAAFETLSEIPLADLTTYTGDGIEETDAVDIGGELFYFEFTRAPLVTRSMMSNQKALNLNHTMKNRNTFQHGSRDFFALNAQPPVEEKTVGGEIVRTPAPLKLGGANVNFLNGAPVYQGEGEQRQIVGYANADFKSIEPSDPEVFIKGADAEAAAMYRQACQEHLIISESASASGRSKKESRDAFAKLLGDLSGDIDALGAWIVKILSRFAADATGKTVDDLRFTFETVVNAGAVDPEEAAQDREDVIEGFLSLATYHTRRGIEDTEAETARLDESEVFQLSRNKKRLEVLKAAREAGIGDEQALALAGFTVDGIDSLLEHKSNGTD